MPGVEGAMPLKCNPTADLITAKTNKKKSISRQRKKKRRKKKVKKKVKEMRSEKNKIFLM